MSQVRSSHASRHKFFVASKHNFILGFNHTDMALRLWHNEKNKINEKTKKNVMLIYGITFMCQPTLINEKLQNKYDTLCVCIVLHS